MFTQYSLGEVGWVQTLKYFLIFICFGLLASLFLLPNKNIIESTQADRDQTFISAIKEAFAHKGYVLLVLGFFVDPNYTSWNTHTWLYARQRDGRLVSNDNFSFNWFFNIFGTLGMGYLGTKYKRIIHSYSLRAVSICIFIFSPPSMLNSIIFGGLLVYYGYLQFLRQME